MNESFFDLIVIGGGAAGFFGAIQVGEQLPGKKILILEKSNKLLSKVKVSGGGRCNVTHHCLNPITLSSHYPRGKKQLKDLFKRFQAEDVVTWFKSKGVDLKVEEDGRMFPVTNSSQTIIDCFLAQAEKHAIHIKTSARVVKVFPTQFDSFQVECQYGEIFTASKILVTTGGSPNLSSYQWIEALGHTILSPIPSLFTFNDSKKKFKDLMGISVPQAHAKIVGTTFSHQGPVLITHWGLSGPAIIKLSAWAAEYLHQQHYRFTVLISWIGTTSEEAIKEQLTNYMQAHPKRKIVNDSLFDLPQRLWRRLCELSEIEDSKMWAEISKRSFNKLIEFLIRCPFEIEGKTTFKEEFVTCGGVPLNEVDLKRMESKKIKNVFFAGEVLNIDGETGGFNFQSAWTTAYVAACAIAGSKS